LAESETPSSLRDHIYKAIARNRTGLVEVRLMLGGDCVAYIQGKIKRIENNIFDVAPMIQISIECRFPLFRGPDYIELVGETGVTVPSPELNDLVSTAPHGFRMQLTFTGSPGSSFTIQGKYGTTQWPFKINKTFQAGDVLYFGSESNQRYLYFFRDGTSRQLLDALALGQIWPTMFPGNNRITFSSSLVEINSITYKTHFWGV
jgi:hypothetical protein